VRAGRRSSIRSRPPRRGAPVVQAAQDAEDPGRVAAGADRADEHVDAPELAGQFERESFVGGRVVRVGVLVGAPGSRQAVEEFSDPLASRLLPAAVGVRGVDEVDGGPVGGQQPYHRRLHARVGDHCERMAEGTRHERQTQAEGAAGGLHDRCARGEVAPLAGAPDHVEGGAVLDPAGIAAFELGPVAARAGGGDAQQRGVADEVERALVAAGVGQGSDQSREVGVDGAHSEVDRHGEASP
jgi:hypothetical protein